MKLVVYQIFFLYRKREMSYEKDSYDISRGKLCHCYTCKFLSEHASSLLFFHFETR